MDPRPCFITSHRVLPYRTPTLYLPYGGYDFKSTQWIARGRQKRVYTAPASTLIVISRALISRSLSLYCSCVRRLEGTPISPCTQVFPGLWIVSSHVLAFSPFWVRHLVKNTIHRPIISNCSPCPVNRTREPTCAAESSTWLPPVPARVFLVCGSPPRPDVVWNRSFQGYGGLP